ncbi:hypothetical protein JW979_02690 [bacterium]|nr:hypothetical protein [candidate division CSSED10-310 bacterium]
MRYWSSLNRKTLKHRCLFILLTGIFFIFSACDDPVMDPYTIAFFSDNEVPTENTISLIRASSTGDILKLAVDAYSITNGVVHTVYFDLVYRDWIMEYIGYEPGDFLEQAGSVSYFIDQDSQDPDRLIVGVTLLGPELYVQGNGVVVFLKFRPRRLGTSYYEFQNMGMRDINGIHGNPITGISWFGGVAKVSR